MKSGMAISAIALFMACGTTLGDIVNQSPDGCWNILDEVPAAVQAQKPWIRPTVFAPASPNWGKLEAVLQQAPAEIVGRGVEGGIVINLPMPDGTFARFQVVNSPVMEPPLAAEFPNIQTYLGQGIDDPAATVRFDTTPQGFHAQILSPRGAVYIDPYSRDNTQVYAVYYKRDYTRPDDGWQCFTTGESRRVVPPLHGIDSPSGTNLRTFRLANACTGEYAAFHGGTVALAQAAIVTAINRVTGVYESECSVRMVLVANNSSIVYTNASTDPFTNNNGGTMLGQNQTTCDSVIGTANYDIGHVFSTGGGGVAGLGVVGIGGQKARGVTGLGAPIGDPFTIDYVAHEMGHQYNANHCFNGTGGSCSGNRSATHAYEPGSASTIMGYAGICGADNLQNNSDPFFGFDGHDAIVALVTSSIPGVGTTVATGNALPTVNGGPDYTIPAQTPFALTAIGSDGNGDPITYSWEQADLGPAATLAAADQGTIPLVRVWNPTSNATRTLPRLSNLLANTLAIGERLPTVARTMKWRVAVRDNRAGGAGYGDDNVNVVVVATGSAFTVTSPNTNVSWSGTQTVTWNVAGTTANGINAANVAILLSTDGGNTFPTTLISSTPNDGSESVTLPNINTSQARIKVAPVGNIFFDISNTNFTITPSLAVPNDPCSAAINVGVGTTAFTTVGATTDGPAEPNWGFCCGDPQINQDIWYTFTATCSGIARVTMCGTANFDTKVAIYRGAACPTVSSAIAANDDFCSSGGPSEVEWPVVQGTVYKIRIGGFTTATGSGSFNLSCTPCYANCDRSTSVPILNVQDFACFLNSFASGSPYANCDQSSVFPYLNVSDFGCFLNLFASGCP